MRKLNAKTKPEMYIVRFWLKNRKTGVTEERVEEAHSFGKEDNVKVSKEIENKYRGQGYKVTIIESKHKGS